MANGTKGPVPAMLSMVWDMIKNVDLTANGGWEISSIEHFLFLIRADATGATRWALDSEAEAPSGAFPAPMTAGDWADLKGGTLDEEENLITVGASEHRIEFYNNGGEPQAKRIDPS